MAAIGLITALAIMVEALIENFFKDVNAKYKVWISGFIGVFLCLAYGADILATLGYISTFPIVGGYVGQVLTGFLIGRGSNYINDLVTRLRMPKLLTSTATVLNVTGEDTKIAIDKAPSV